MPIAAARSVFRSPAVRTAAARLAAKPKASPSPFRLPSRTPLPQRLFRSPVEMSACVNSMQPYHTATASALMTSMLAISRCGFGWLTEGLDGTYMKIEKQTSILFPSPFPIFVYKKLVNIALN